MNYQKVLLTTRSPESVPIKNCTNKLLCCRTFLPDHKNAVCLTCGTQHGTYLLFQFRTIIFGVYFLPRRVTDRTAELTFYCTLFRKNKRAGEMWREFNGPAGGVMGIAYLSLPAPSAVRYIGCEY